MNEIRMIFNWIDSLTPLEFFSTCLAMIFFIYWIEAKLKLRVYEKNTGGWLN